MATSLTDPLTRHLTHDERDVEDPYVDELLRKYCSHEARLEAALRHADGGAADEDDEQLIDAALAERVMQFKEAAAATAAVGSDTEDTSSSDPLEAAKRLSQENIDSVCDDFVARFLQQGASVADLHEDLKQCNSYLLHMEDSLGHFLERLGRVRAEIIELREKASLVAVRAANVGAVETIIAEILAHLTVPPDVIQVIVSSNEYNLGQQFTLSVRRLMRILRYRQGLWQRGAGVPSSSSGSGGGHATPSPSPSKRSMANSAPALFASPAAQTGSSGNLADLGLGIGANDSLASSFATDPSINSRLQTPAAGASGGVTGGASSSSSRSIHLHLHECRAYHEVLGVLDDITVFAALKIKSFLLQEINVLSKPRTNIAIQQANVLLPHKHLVAFLRHAPALLRHAHLHRGGGGGGNQPHPGVFAGQPVQQPQQPLVHFRIVSSLYQIVKSSYETILSRSYTEKMHQYLHAMNALEAPHVFSGGASAASSTAAFGVDERTNSSSSGGGGWTSFFTRVVPTSTPNFAQPMLIERSTAVTARDFTIGERASVFEKLFAPPLIPHVERLAKRKHFYEETFRSLNVLLMDGVTSEFLFSFEFFAADTTVYVEVFRKTIQLVIDYVSEVMLQNTPQSSSAGGAASATATTAKSGFRDPKSGFQMSSCNKDLCGLLSLIRLTHLFKVHMHHTRKIHILDGYYDALLLLLWPAFKDALQVQLLAIKSLRSKDAAAFLSGFRTVQECLAAVHPITQRYAELAASLMLLGSSVPVPFSLINNSLDAEAEGNCGDSHQSMSFAGASDAASDAGSDASSLSTTTATAAVRAAVFAQMIELDDDIVESAHRFQVLKTNLSVLRIEVDRMLTSLGAELAAGTVSASAESRPIVAALRVNNMFHVLQRWAAAEPLRRDPYGAFNMAAAAQLKSSGTGHLDPSGAAAGAPGSAAARDGSDASPPAYFRKGAAAVTTAPVTSASSDAPSYIMATCVGTDDFEAVQKSFAAAKVEFVEEALRQVFPSLVKAVCSIDALPPATVENFAVDFVTTWRQGLERVRGIVKQHIADPDNSVDILKQVFMQALLYNTRLHTLVGSLEKPSRPVRTLVVSNQQLLTTMRQMVALDGDHSGGGASSPTQAMDDDDL